MRKQIGLTMLCAVMAGLGMHGCDSTSGFTCPGAETRVGDLCDAAGGSGEVILCGDINQNAQLKKPCTYHIKESTFVTNGTLTIDPGVHIVGDRAAALVITQNGKIEAVGGATADDVIVFSSSAPVGSRKA